MRIIILPNREVLIDGTYGTQYENNAEVIELIVPEFLKDKDCLMWVRDEGNNLFAYEIENLNFSLEAEITQNSEVYIYFTFTKNEYKFITKTIKATFNENVNFLDSISTGEFYDYMYKLRNLDKIINDFQKQTQDLIEDINTVFDNKVASFDDKVEEEKTSFDNLTSEKQTELENFVTTWKSESTEDLNSKQIEIEESIGNSKEIALNNIQTKTENSISSIQLEVETATTNLNEVIEDGTNLINTTSSQKISDIENTATTLLESYNENAGEKVDEYNQNASQLINAIEVLNEKVDKVDKVTSNLDCHVYGIRRKLTDNYSSEWERIEESVGLVANATHDGTEVQNDFDNLAPWKDIKSFNLDMETGDITAFYGDENFAFDGSNGDVFTRIPNFWYNIYTENDYLYIKIADYAKAGFKEIKSFDIARYKTTIGEDEKFHSYSESEIERTHSRDFSFLSSLHEQLEENYCFMDWRYFVLQILFLVEFATFDSKTILGSGIYGMKYQYDSIIENSENSNCYKTRYYGEDKRIVGERIRIEQNSIDYYRTITSIEKEEGTTNNYIVTFDGEPLSLTTSDKIHSTYQKTGGCDSLGMKSGCLADDGKHNIIYRGIEELYGNCKTIIDGINSKNAKVYICYEPENYEFAKYEKPYKKLGYTMPSKNSYIAKELGLDYNNPLVFLPKVAGTTSNDFLDCTQKNDKLYEDSILTTIGHYAFETTKLSLWGYHFYSSGMDLLSTRLIKYK